MDIPLIQEIPVLPIVEKILFKYGIRIFDRLASIEFPARYFHGKSLPCQGTFVADSWIAVFPGIKK